MAPGSCVLTLKPIDLENLSRGAKRKARIVLCGNVVADYSDSSTSILDAAAFLATGSFACEDIFYGSKCGSRAQSHLHFKGQPTEVTCNLEVLKQLQKVG
eukprot:285132-Amphidinium_carterae.1